MRHPRAWVFPLDMYDGLSPKDVENGHRRPNPRTSVRAAGADVRAFDRESEGHAAVAVSARPLIDPLRARVRGTGGGP